MQNPYYGLTFTVKWLTMFFAHTKREMCTVVYIYLVFFYTFCHDLLEFLDSHYFVLYILFICGVLNTGQIVFQTQFQKLIFVFCQCSELFFSFWRPLVDTYTVLVWYFSQEYTLSDHLQRLCWVPYSWWKPCKKCLLFTLCRVLVTNKQKNKEDQ